ncbi:sfsA, partial [Symbiodinium sp. KB8]
ASRHVTELAALAQAGSQCTVIFVVQRGDLHGMVRPSSHHDPTFAKACRQAAATGVRFRAVLVACSLQGLTVQREADVDLSEYDASPIVQWVAENRDSTGWIRSASQRRVANGPFPHEKKAKAQRRPV